VNEPSLTCLIILASWVLERRVEGSTTFGLMELEVQSVGIARIKLPIYPPEGKSPIHLSAILFGRQRPMENVYATPVESVKF